MATTKLTHTAPQARDFSAATRKALLTQGVAIIGVTLVPGSGDMPFANGETGYYLNDNGTHRVMLRREVVALAEKQVERFYVGPFSRYVIEVGDGTARVFDGERVDSTGRACCVWTADRREDAIAWAEQQIAADPSMVNSD